MTDRIPDSVPPEPGRQPQMETFRADKPRGGGLVIGPGWRIAAVLLLMALMFGALAAAWVWKSTISTAPPIPSREALWTVGRMPGMTFMDRDGKIIATRGARHGQRVTLRSLPPYVPRAFLAAEDRRFYKHGPVDALGILRGGAGQSFSGLDHPGRIDPDSADRQDLVLDPRPDLQAQGAGNAARLAPGKHDEQG